MDGSGHSSAHDSGDTDMTMSLSALADSGDISGASGLEELTDLSHSDPVLREDLKGRNKIERKQLLHDLQFLRIELSRKSLIIDNLKAQHMSQVEELEEKLCNALHEKQVLKARLEGALAIQQDDAKKRKEKMERDMKIILDRQRELEQTNRRLQAKASNIQSQLQRDCNITENEYIELKSQPVDDMTIADYFSMRLYEVLQPMKIECDNLRAQRNKLSSDLAQSSHTIHNYEQELLQERRRRSNAEVQLQGAKDETATARKALNEHSGKAQRFDAVYEERNKLDRDFSELVKKHSYLEAENKTLQSQLIELKNDRGQLQQTEQLLKQDKEYLTKNLSETTIKLQNSEDSLQRTQNQLERAKNAREELYEKYAASRDEARSVYERRLQTEVDKMRLQTENELEKLRVDSKETYERENRGLREARDHAIQERNQLSELRDDAERKCEMYASELRALESGIDARLSDFQNEARIKTFELDRLQLVHEETCKNLERVQNESERLTRKLELVTTEYGEMQRQATATETELRTTIRDVQSRLIAYEKLEQEMDDVILQAAEVESGDKQKSASEAEKVLFSYGYGANVPTSAKHRMKQSVHLARRVLQLEKINSSLHADIQRREEEMKDVCAKLKRSNKLLDESRQPYSYLIESMRKRDEELEEKRNRVLDLEEQLDSIKIENAELRETKRYMSADLDRLLNNRQEIALIKRVLANVASPSRGNHGDWDHQETLESRRRSTPLPVKESRVFKGSGKKRSDEDGPMTSPSPLVFTKYEKTSKVNPERYRKMKELMKN